MPDTSKVPSQLKIVRDSFCKVQTVKKGGLEDTLNLTAIYRLINGVSNFVYLLGTLRILFAQQNNKNCIYFSDKSIRSIQINVDFIDNAVSKPGPIENTELADPENMDHLKRDLEEGVEYQWLQEEQWKLLFSWYGGGPIYARNVFASNCVEAHPIILKFAIVNADGSYDIQNPELRPFSTLFSLGQVAATFVDNDADKEEEVMSPSVHLWVPFAELKSMYTCVNARNVQVTLKDLEHVDHTRYVEIPNDYLHTLLGNLHFSKNVVFLVEKKCNPMPGSAFVWPLVKGVETWNQFEVGDILDVQVWCISSHFNDRMN
ncbi:ubiquitin-specific protease [Reticulomyxa filosa]|uniref:Ubiquitin-specific protease n=1 Tax=Reticulomyxa filosa TaxID=46433 RepID=X6M2A7_RETFI|nr:ubiquitin-specific protease [Reticulomyxa filosa]|eukprot:ETO08303.1 ubiquitin-specific protease [Reticulomyxa filosa]